MAHSQIKETSLLNFDKNWLYRRASLKEGNPQVKDIWSWNREAEAIVDIFCT